MKNNDDINKLFGKVLKQNRIEAGLSQEEFAIKSGIHRTYISSVERGKKSPSLTIINKLLDALNLSFGEFYRKLDVLKNSKVKIDLTNTSFDKEVSQTIIDNLQNHILLLTLNFEVSKRNKSIFKFFKVKDKDENDYSNYFLSEKNYKQHLDALTKVIKYKKSIKFISNMKINDKIHIFETKMIPLFKLGCLNEIIEDRCDITEYIRLEKSNRNKTMTSKLKRTNKNSVLIMDDCLLIREILMFHLSKMRYNSSAVSNGHSAIRKYKKNMIEKKEFNLVIFDLLIFDGLGGIETLKELKKLNPKLKSIAISGYDHFTEKEIKNTGFDRFLQKPIDNNKLEQAIYDLLEV